MLTSIIFMILTVILLGLAAVDSIQIMGINRWINPLKFSISIASYTITLAIFLLYLPNFEKAKKIITIGVILIMFGEIILITMQAARGATAHFNTKTPFDGMVFTATGILIGINTLLIIWLTNIYFRAEIDLPKSIVWGLRLGLIVFLVSSFQGGYMATQTGHTVGAADGGAGLPFVNWSTVAGDLRVAHFLGLHAFQIIPLFSLAVYYLHKQLRFIEPTIFTFVFTFLYFAAFVFLFTQALAGKPFIEQQLYSEQFEMILNQK